MSASRTRRSPSRSPRTARLSRAPPDREGPVDTEDVLREPRRRQKKELDGELDELKTAQDEAEELRRRQGARSPPRRRYAARRDRGQPKRALAAATRRRRKLAEEGSTTRVAQRGQPAATSVRTTARSVADGRAPYAGIRLHRRGLRAAVRQLLAFPQGIDIVARLRDARPRDRPGDGPLHRLELRRRLRTRHGS